MKAGGVELPAVVFDACALIDLVDQDPGLIRLIGAHIAHVVVPAPVLAQVSTLDRDGAVALSLTIHEPSEAQLEEASRRRARLSFEDALCLVVARDLGLPCVTSDVGLVKACSSIVECWESWRPLLELVRVGKLEQDVCLAAVREMRDRNAYITTDVFQMFEKRLRSVARRTKRCGPER